MITLNYRDSRPIYEQVCDGLRRLSVSGVIADGDKLPSVRALATQLAINPNTIQRAYNELEARGYCCSVPGKGCFAVHTYRERDDKRRRALEELVKEIRAKQHEFDNHLNAILNMHLTIDNYEELVAKQSEYITENAREDDSRKYLPLLKISDKILAGFIYSKIVRAPEYVQTDIRVWNKEIVS